VEHGYSLRPVFEDYEVFEKGDRTNPLVVVRDRALAEKIARGLDLVDLENDDERFARALR
jgi:hypothetical protein